MTAYYNEHDPKAAAWLRELIKVGAIAPGEVDERSIEDVLPSDLRGFVQCHFFAGIGVWSYALGQADWPDDRPVWTGSCPCQPFSAAGKGAGFDDERHLWPAFHWLIAQCRPSVVFGEQVASKAVDAWVDLVCADMEALGYAFGAVPFPSAGVGAPHIRDRTYWVADSARQRLDGREDTSRQARRSRAEDGCATSELADSSISGRREERAHVGGVAARDRTEGLASGFVDGGVSSGPADASSERVPSKEPGETGAAPGRVQAGAQQREWIRHDSGAGVCTLIDGEFSTGSTDGLWRNADWIFCRDGKWRPVEPGTFPLAHGAPARVGRLRGYGNAVNAEAAKVWIETCMSVSNETA